MSKGLGIIERTILAALNDNEVKKVRDIAHQVANKLGWGISNGKLTDTFRASFSRATKQLTKKGLISRCINRKTSTLYKHKPPQLRPYEIALMNSMKERSERIGKIEVPSNYHYYGWTIEKGQEVALFRVDGKKRQRHIPIPTNVNT